MQYRQTCVVFTLSPYERQEYKRVLNVYCLHNGVHVHQCAILCMWVCSVSGRRVTVSGVVWRKLWDVVLKQIETESERERLQKKSSNRHPNIQTLAPLRLHFSQLGPCMDILYRDLPLPHTHAHWFSTSQRRRLECSVDKPKETGARSERYELFVLLETWRRWHDHDPSLFWMSRVEAMVILSQNIHPQQLDCEGKKYLPHLGPSNILVIAGTALKGYRHPPGVNLKVTPSVNIYSALKKVRNRQCTEDVYLFTAIWGVTFILNFCSEDIPVLWGCFVMSTCSVVSILHPTQVNVSGWGSI